MRSNRLLGEDHEMQGLMRALDGRYLPPAPGGDLIRNPQVLPTGRNFYSVDPKAVPSRLAWETGQAMAESLAARYLADHGEYPRSVGLSVWGTAAMRTSGDDIAEIARKRGGGQPSLLQDVIKKRRTEIDYLNGYVCEQGKQRGT